MTEESTKIKLLRAIDDMEYIGRAMFDTRLGPGKDPIPMDELGKMAVEKQKEMDKLLEEAEEQARLQGEMDQLRAEVEVKDRAIKELQRGLRTVEQQVRKDVYEARLKLDYIRQAQVNPVNSEDLIRYAHRISASNGFAAPYNWQPGDQRRPYPTDFEMRQGFLSQQSSYTDHMSTASRTGISATEMSVSTAPSSASAISYSSSSEVMTPAPSHTLDLRGHNKENENLDQSGSDTSSSSSSDE